MRAGWHGSAPHRRRRWLCRSANGDPTHRFTEELPRQQASASHCSECSSVLDPWEGQAGAREYAFSARDIAHALALVANGASYRRAVAARFPRPGARAPHYQWSDLHVRRALEDVLAPLHGQPPTHTVWQRLPVALRWIAT